MSNQKLDQLLGAFIRKHPHLEQHLFADAGIRLMYTDSQIAEQVHRHFTEQGVPVLSVHDSFIVDYTRVGELRQVMAEASEAVVGKPLEVAGAAGLDDVLGKPDFPILDFIAYRQMVRSEGYLTRLRAHEERVGLIVTPYDRTP
ncbi:hypothetical protein [Aestuariicoccus sp. MJ-SS9]|uniref:hypothetical protein n=1 Tax=Aestuariicoccus sp. MJ-SS9 TaxID=3079855 RepID=UPI00290C9697|nr:hypothetical protein [Aestuariicoccus sp. MJ-SS9]MDU8912517.1 hypothetical protein [Aestuariicoccus sp. MJ-SS9]